jgi:hypothetical protein
MTMKAQTRAQAFDEKLAGSRLFWLAYQKGFWCHGMMFFEADLVLGGDQPLCLDRALRPVSGDLLLIGEGRRIESMAMLDVSPCMERGQEVALTLSLAMGPLARALEVPPQWLGRRPVEVARCGRLRRHRLSDFEMTGRVLRLGGPGEQALRQELRQVVTDEFLSYV